MAPLPTRRESGFAGLQKIFQCLITNPKWVCSENEDCLVKKTWSHGLNYSAMSVILTTERQLAESAGLEKHLLVLGEKMAGTGLPKANCTQQLSRALTFIPEWGVEEQLTGICENDCLDRFSFVHIMIVYYNFMYVMYFPFFFPTWCPGHCEWFVLSWYKCVLCVIPPLPQGIKV